MNNQELSNNFDALVSSYRRFKDFDNKENLDSVEFDEYEKSVFLTEAQEELVESFYNGRNPYGESFESTEEMRRYLAPLVVEERLEPMQNTSGVIGMGSKSKFFTLPEDVWFITYENVNVIGRDCENLLPMEVYPVRQDEYNKLRKNPFRGANDRRSLRLDLSDGVVEIVSKYEVTEYYVRYLRKLKPIVLEDLPDGLDIRGERMEHECELHEALHRKVLERAVERALRSKLMGAGNK